MKHATLESTADEIIRETGIKSDVDQKIFRVNYGDRHTFFEAMKIAKRVHGRTGYARIDMSRHEGHRVGIAEIGKSNIWLY